MNEGYIIIRDVPESELESILMDFVDMYSDNEATDGIRLYKKIKEENSFLILFTNAPEFGIFNFLVNYLNYPRNYRNFHPYLRGYYPAKDIDPQGKYATGDWVKVYISQYDKTYDNVNFVNINGESYLYDFGRNNIEPSQVPEEQFDIELPDKNEYEHVIDILHNPEPPAPEKPKPWWKFW